VVSLGNHDTVHPGRLSRLPPRVPTRFRMDWRQTLLIALCQSCPSSDRNQVKGCRHRNGGHKQLDYYIATWQYSRMAINELDPLSLTFGALADPTRRAILARLASGDADVSELMKPFDLSQPTISKHLNVLERAGLVMRGRDAQRRPRTLVAVPLKDIADWMEPFRHFWEEKFAGLDGYLKEMQKKKTQKKGNHRGRTKR
jgi:DNA-binding transcriptional ArsR family regulator